MIRVLVVEDSPVVREFLVHLLNSDPEVRVVGTAKDGEEALRAVMRAKPDVISMDIHMPKMNGLEATRRIMETNPTPIVIVSGSSNTKEVARTFHAMEAGALAIVQRPAGAGHPDHEETVAELVRTIKLMSEVKVVRRWARARRSEAIPAVSPPEEPKLGRATEELQLVAIGASTGGPLALQTILSGLPKDFSAPIVIVQHMTTGFIQGFVEWLDQTSELSVHLAAPGEFVRPGNAYVAPDGCQMKLAAGGRIGLTADAPENHLRPSVSYLFRSVANVYGRNAVGVLLTGMGKDGAEELKLLRDRGAVTIAQAKETCVVHGMPGEAIALDAAAFVLSPGEISVLLAQLGNSKGTRQ